MIDGNVTGKSIKGKITSIPKVDTTLSKEGQCAESKATGEALNNKVNLRDIADNLTTADASKVLSANQGVELKKLIDDEVADIMDEITAESNERREAITGLTEANAASFFNLGKDVDTLKANVSTANGDIATLGEDVARLQNEVNSINPKTAFTYTGNGEAVARQITVGYDCHAILVICVGQGKNKIGLITSVGGVMTEVPDPFMATMYGPISVNATYINRELYIYPRESEGEYKNNEYMNALGRTYTCIPL